MNERGSIARSIPGRVSADGRHHPRRPTEVADGTMSTLALVLVFYLGVTFALPSYFTLDLPFVNSYFLASCAAALIGWSIRFPYRPLGGYMVAAATFSFFTVTSGVSIWDTTAMYMSVTIIVWTMFIVPGLAFLLADPKFRRTFLFALGAGMATYGFMRVFWIVTGPPSRALMLQNGDGSIWWFLRANRDEIDAIALLTVPLLFLWNKGNRIRGRWVMAGLIVFWLLTSGGRQGPVILSAMGIVYLGLAPGFVRRVRSILIVLVVAVTAFYASQLLGPHSQVGRTRVTRLLSGERNASDRERAILNERAWHLGWENPIFGHGYHRLLGTYDPAINRARNAREARAAQQGGIHNLYLWWFQTIGVPGTLGYLAMWGVVLFFLIRSRGDPDIRLATASYVGVLLSVGFHTAHQDLPYFSLAMALAVLAGGSRDRIAAERDGIASIRPG